MTQGIIYEVQVPVAGAPGIAPGEALSGNYLLEPVRQAMRQVGVDKDSKSFILHFFPNSPQAVSLAFFPVADVSPREKTIAFVRAGKVCGPGCKPVEIGCFFWASERDAEAFNAASQFLRGSEALQRKHYQSIGQLSIAADGRGLAVLGGADGDRADRALMAHMLGLAYLRVLEDSIGRLASLSRSKLHAELEAMHEELSYFLAACYFDEPVKVTANEVGPVYAEVRHRLRLRELKNDLVDQLERVVGAARMKRLGEESAFESRIQRRLTTLGLVIACVGLLQLAQTTPAQLGVFFSSWAGCFQGGKSCFAEPSPASSPGPGTAPKPTGPKEKQGG